MKFTKAAVSNLSPGTGDRFEWDDTLPGFGVRARGGKLTYVAQFRVGAQTRRKTIGDVRKLDLDIARKIARQLFAQAALGVDAAAERRAKTRAAAAPTVGAVADMYCSAKRSVWRPATQQVAEIYFRRQWGPLRDLPIAMPPAAMRPRVAARLHEIAKESGLVSARQARTHLRALFNWAAREGLCEANPAAFTNDPAQGVKSRERTLSDDELQMVWRACQDDDFGRIIKLLVLTGCRRSEIGSLCWNELDIDTGMMTVPGGRTKNHRTLELTLPGVAADILRSIAARPGQDFLFGSGSGGYKSWDSGMEALNKRISAAGKPLENWSLHDVRRTVRSGMGKLGIAPHVAERVIGHAARGVEATYDRYSYAPQIKAALAAWADHVVELVEGRPNAASNVVPMTG